MTQSEQFRHGQSITVRLMGGTFPGTFDHAVGYMATVIVWSGRTGRIVSVWMDQIRARASD